MPVKRKNMATPRARPSNRYRNRRVFYGGVVKNKTNAWWTKLAWFAGAAARVISFLSGGWAIGVGSTYKDVGQKVVMVLTPADVIHGSNVCQTEPVKGSGNLYHRNDKAIICNFREAKVNSIRVTVAPAENQENLNMTVAVISAEGLAESTTIPEYFTGTTSSTAARSFVGYERVRATLSMEHLHNKVSALTEAQVCSMSSSACRTGAAAALKPLSVNWKNPHPRFVSLGLFAANRIDQGEIKDSGLDVNENPICAVVVYLSQFDATADLASIPIRIEVSSSFECRLPGPSRFSAYYYQQYQDIDVSLREIWSGNKLLAVCNVDTPFEEVVSDHDNMDIVSYTDCA
jgi:hypothetical protein